jgi:hypothetical protein
VSWVPTGTWLVGLAGLERLTGESGRWVSRVPRRWLGLGLARYRGYVSLGVGDVVSPGQVDQDQGVAERVCHDRQPADRDVERLGQYPAAGRPDRGGCLVSGGDKPVWFVTLPGGQDDLRVAAGQGQAGLADVVVAPP